MIVIGIDGLESEGGMRRRRASEWLMTEVSGKGWPRGGATYVVSPNKSRKGDKEGFCTLVQRREI